MTTPRPRHSRLRATVLSLAALAAIVTACSSAINRAGTAPVARDARVAAPAAQAAPVAPAATPSQAYFEYQIDEPVRYAPETGQIKYPPTEKAAGVEGEVLTQFIVGTDGLVEPGSFRVFSGTVVGSDGKKQSVAKAEADFGPFEIAVRDALPSMRFVPAKLKGVPVRGIVQQPFVFAIQK